MHIDPTTHEHALNGGVYTYEADYDIAGDAVTWQAEVTHAERAPRRIDGRIGMPGEAAAVVAEQAVRDAIARRIDALDAPR